MPTLVRTGLLIGLLLCGFDSLLYASEADELREKAESIQREAAALAKLGKRDEALRLNRESRELRERAKEMELEKYLEDIPPQMRERAKNLTRAMQRNDHIRVAAELLQAAEMNDLARELIERVEPMEEEVRQGRERFEEEMQRVRIARAKGEPYSAVDALRFEVEKLRAEIKELREQVKDK